MDDIFRVRLNCVDHYQATPTDLDPPLFGIHGSTQRVNAPALPVIRVFGSTETGQKVCAHIHGALPYLYIEYRGSLQQDAVNAYIHQLRASIDHALAVSYRRNTYDNNVVYVAYISLVKGVPFFGYHVGYRYFLKIYLLNPSNMTRFADLLHQGAIMNQPLQPFEAHLQYLAQWMCDYNLYGCSYIDCKHVKFRSPIPEYLEMESTQHKWHDRSIPDHLVSDPATYPRKSHCSIEVDICVQDIMNRNEIVQRDLHHNFVERFEYLKPDEKLVHSLAGLWKDETRRRKLRMGLSDPSSSPFPPEVLISMSADPRRTDKGGWIHEEELRERIKSLIEKERMEGSANLSFEQFVSQDPLQKTIQTALDSVEDLFPERLKASSGTSSNNVPDESTPDRPHPDSVVVDESCIPKFDADEFPYESDEDVARHLMLSQKLRDRKKVNDENLLNKSTLDRIEESEPPREEGAKGNNNLVLPSSQKTNERQTSLEREEKLENGASSAVAKVLDASRKVSQSTNGATGSGIFEGATAPSRKRQKLSHAISTGSRQEASHVAASDELRPPPPRHARFAEDIAESNGASVTNQDSRPRQSQESSTPSGSQLSQSSIKANGRELNRSGSFQVVKDPYGFDKQSGIKSADNSSESAPPRRVLNRSASSKVSPRTSSDNLLASFPLRSALEQNTAFGKDINYGFETSTMHNVLALATFPPNPRDVVETLSRRGLPDQIYQDAYYSDEKDVPEKSRDYAGREFKIESSTIPFLPAFDVTGESPACFGAKPPVVVDRSKQEQMYQRNQYACNLRNWEMARLPPSRADVERWVQQSDLQARQSSSLSGLVKVSSSTQRQNGQRRGDLSQIEGPTQKNPHGFKFSQKQHSTSVRHETQYMSTMSLEVHANTRHQLVADPEHDEIQCIFWCIKSDDDEMMSNGDRESTKVGIVVLSQGKDTGRRITKETGLQVEEEDTELDVINRIVDIVRSFDPDVLTGFEVHNGSWGYLIERARIKFEYDLCDEFSRMLSQSHGRFGKDADRWGFNHTSTIRVTGRHTINIWRAMRSELNLLQYTMENVVFHLLHKRIPHYSHEDLTTWYTSKAPRDLAKCINYYISRVQMDLEILEANELIPRTSEQARLIGVDFFSVFSRGSQFKVESFMFRIAKPENFLLVSPSRKQVGQQNALECLPLVMEPQSDFYNSPLLVLDFQSLYPSIMIAYNYCYSTCLGRIVGWRGQNKMGFADFKRQPQLLELVQDYVNIAPNGMMYVKPEMRKSLLAKMLGEILETRVMVKSGMKADKDDKTLQQLLNNRQLALKLLANVTYGYTSASFSGRMPCAEIADSIVQTARETLEKSIAFIHSVERWGAEVVYGDTDSLFVYLKGRTREQAFAIGNEIATAVTNRNPKPMKLKFEKVYHPCVLLAKKRYVGFKYESLSQVEPEFDAKGIETVRRDGTPAEQKIEEKALKLLFRSADLSQIKAYFQRQCAKIMSGRVSIQDFSFAKEVKLGSYADKGPPPPGALISTRRMLADPRTEPQYGERVPYVVITGAPGARLIDRCVAPEALLKDDSAELDAEYYISKNLIPPLERIFNLVGANVRQWYDEMPKIQRIRDLHVIPATVADDKASAGNGLARKTLESYMKSSHCIVCRVKLLPPAKIHQSEDKEISPFCSSCMDDKSGSLYTLRTRLQAAEKKLITIEKVCRSCSSLSWGEEIKCDSKDCPVFYTRVRARAVESRGKLVAEKAVELLELDTDDRRLDW